MADHALAVATARCRHVMVIGHARVIVVQRELHHVEVINRVKVIGLEKVDDQKHAKVTGPARVIAGQRELHRVKVTVHAKVIGLVTVLILADPKGARPKCAKVDAVRGDQASVSARPAQVLVDLAPVAGADLDLPDLDRLARVALVREPKAIVVEAKPSVHHAAKMSALAVRIVRPAMRMRPSRQPFETSPAAEGAWPSAVAVS